MANVTIDATALEEMAAKIDELPLLPQVLVQVLQLNADNERYFEAFELLAKEDPALTVRLIALANSAAFAPATPLVTIRDALVRLGTAQVRGLVASLAVQRVFMPTDDNQVRLWRHSVSAAVAAETVARLAADLDVDSGEAYLIGLLHDVGRFVMFEHAPTELLRVDESEWQSPEHLIEADVEIFQFTHSELGFLACQHWGMPKSIANSIRNHHQPLPTVRPGTPEAMDYCLQVADRLCIAVIEDPAKATHEDTSLVEVITERVLGPTFREDFVQASALAGAVPAIRDKSHSLLAGLGF